MRTSNILKSVLIAAAFASVTPLAMLAGCSGNDPIYGLSQPRPPADSGRRDGDATMQGDGPADGPMDGTSDGAPDTMVTDAPADTTVADSPSMDAPADVADE